jgi:hypothetical protein
MGKFVKLNSAKEVIALMGSVVYVVYFTRSGEAP